MKKPHSEDIFNVRDIPVSMMRRGIAQGTGQDIDELASKPIIGIANSQTEFNPGHMHLGLMAERVKEGVHAGGGIPFVFNVPAPCDGIAMGHQGMKFILAQRDLIADLVETHVRSMRFDALVFIASCDKIIPGMIIAAARLDLPSIFITGGPGSFGIRFRATMSGSVSHNDYGDLMDKIATATCATCGSCEVMGTANTLQCLTDALGLCLPGASTIPAFHAEKLVAARKTGLRIVKMVEEELTARKVLTPEAVENALMTDLAIGGSTNVTLHLPAIAHSIGMELPLDTFNAFNTRIPTLCSVAPNGPHGLIDLHVAGGIPAVMKMISDDLHLDAMTVTGKPIQAGIKQARVLDPAVIRTRTEPYLPEGGTVVLKGSLAPDGAVVKQSAVQADMRVFSGPARVFNSEAECLAAIRQQQLRDGEVLVIRYEGPKGGPGMPEMLAVTMALEMSKVYRIALVTDGRFSGASAGPCVGHVSPEAFVGGPIGLLRDGDMISIDIPARKLDVDLSEAELAKRRAEWKPVERDVPPGYMRRYRKHVGSAAHGALVD